MRRNCWVLRMTHEVVELLGDVVISAAGWFFALLQGPVSRDHGCDILVLRILVYLS
jgi:hypothetical protein